MTKPRVVKTVAQMQAISRAAKRAGKKIACVPTMGYLHDGHIALVKAAKKFGDIVVATIFVNPTQFGPKEDLARYPRDFKGDMAKLASAGADYVYYPAVAEMYPENYQTYINVEKVSQGLCGAFRPVHFRGVATVVAKLFNIVEPDVAVFGNKDYQQLKVIARMVRDLNFPVKVIGHETVREKDGLAMSSRNAYLSQDDRANAVSLSRALFSAKKMVASGEHSAAKLVKKARAVISAVGSPRIEYIEIRDAETLEPVTRIEKPCQMLLAVWQGKTRLIDNIRLNPKRS
jgi:pantoate--beta-alanine ligase